MTRLPLLAAAVLTATGAAAEEPRDGIVSEVKVGLFQHDIAFLPASDEDGQAVNAEILFRSPGFLDAIRSPRPHLGTTIALDGQTDQVYAGLTWTFRPFDGGFAPLSLSAFGGGAVHDGRIDTSNSEDKSLGSPVLFRFGAEIGWDLTEHLNASIYYSHISNAFLAHPNEGLEHGGVRVGWRF
jgi:lipid A 3-O-deacylase